MDHAIAADGARIAWSSRGTGEPLLLMSGQGVSSRSWAPLLPALSRRHRVITMDARGVGDSEPGSDAGFSTPAMAHDAVAVLDAAGEARAHVYGHSMGGRVGQWLAINHADRVGSLVLGATTGGDAGGATRSADATRRLLRGDPGALTPLFFTDAFAAAHPDQVAEIFRRSATGPAQALLFRASRAHDAWDQLARITAPTLVLHGAEDELTPPGNAELLAERIPDSSLVVLAGQRHGYFLESDEATDVVLEFCAAHPLR